MPTPLEILLDPLSLVIIGLYAAIITLEALFPARKLPDVKGWKLRGLVSFAVFFYVSVYVPLVWDKYLVGLQAFDLSKVNPWISLCVSIFLFELLIYIWHRFMHAQDWLWLSFHQMHHSAERVDSYGAFFYSPLDMLGFTFISSLTLSLFVGLPPHTVTGFILFSTFLVFFQHANIKTPQWLGYIIQRPESHSVHHQTGIHAYNYSDFPVFDILFGTFKNPKHYSPQTGFYDGASARIPAMLVFKDIDKNR